MNTPSDDNCAPKKIKIKISKNRLNKSPLTVLYLIEIRGMPSVD